MVENNQEKQSWVWEVHALQQDHVWSNDVVGAYEDLTEDFDDIANVICYKIGVEEGECRLYNTREIIEKIQDEVIFQDEKEELISKLLFNPSEINTFDYAIDNILTTTDSIDIMEPYGDPITGQ